MNVSCCCCWADFWVVLLTDLRLRHFSTASCTTGDWICGDSHWSFPASLLICNCSNVLTSMYQYVYIKCVCTGLFWCSSTSVHSLWLSRNLFTEPNRSVVWSCYIGGPYIVDIIERLLSSYYTNIHVIYYILYYYYYYYLLTTTTTTTTNIYNTSKYIM